MVYWKTVDSGGEIPLTAEVGPLQFSAASDGRPASVVGGFFLFLSRLVR